MVHVDLPPETTILADSESSQFHNCHKIKEKFYDWGEKIYNDLAQQQREKKICLCSWWMFHYVHQLIAAFVCLLLFGAEHVAHNEFIRTFSLKTAACCVWKWTWMKAQLWARHQHCGPNYSKRSTALERAEASGERFGKVLSLFNETQSHWSIVNVNVQINKATWVLSGKWA